MYLAIINTTNNIVENCVVPPLTGDVWLPPEGYVAIETEVGAIGDVWDGVSFTKPESTP